MLIGMLVWAGIAATDLTAGQAHTQMRPRSLTECRTTAALAGGQWRGLGLIDGRGEVLAGLRPGGLDAWPCPPQFPAHDEQE
jgi:hypothetical protein